MPREYDLQMEETLRRTLAATKNPNFKKIALQQGVSYNVVARVARTMGIPMRSGGRPLDAEVAKRLEDLIRTGMPAIRAAEEVGVSHYRALQMQRTLFPDRRVERLRTRQKALELVLTEGVTAHAACKRLGILTSSTWVKEQADARRAQKEAQDGAALTENR